MRDTLLCKSKGSDSTRSKYSSTYLTTTWPGSPFVAFNIVPPLLSHRPPPGRKRGEKTNLCTHSYSKVVSIMNNHHIVILFVLALTMAFLSHFQMTNRTFYHFTSVKMDRIWIHFHCNWLTICCVLILEKQPTLSNYFFIFFKDQFKQIALKRLVTRELCFGNGWQWIS